jgi:hypothetical protein
MWADSKLICSLSYRNGKIKYAFVRIRRGEAPLLLTWGQKGKRFLLLMRRAPVQTFRKIVCFSTGETEMVAGVHIYTELIGLYVVLKRWAAQSQDNVCHILFSQQRETKLNT